MFRQLFRSYFILCLWICATSPAGAEVWTESDWSAGNWESIDQLDGDTAVGELVLKTNPLEFVPAFDATDYEGVWDLAVWQDRLYLAAGPNPPMMSDGGDILVYDYQSNSCTVDYSVNEQGIVVLEVHDGVLVSPGVDSIRSNYWGCFYYNAGEGWVKQETLPFSVHVFEVFFHQGKIWVTTGQGTPNNRGSLFSTADYGETWVEEFTVWTQPPESMFRRIYGAAPFGDSIFMQSDFKEPEGRVILELQSDGTVVEHPITAHTHGIGSFQEFAGKLWCRLRYSLNAYDGTSWELYDSPVGAPNYASRAMTVFNDRLYIGGVQNICASDDGLNWDYSQIDQNTDRVFETLEAFHGRLFAGSNPLGEVFVSTVPEAGILDSQVHCFASPVANGLLKWQGLLQGPQTQIKFQIRSGADEIELQSAGFVGPDGSPGSWYTTSGTALSTAHVGDTCFQYRVRLESGDPAMAPVLQSFTLETGLPASAPNPAGIKLDLKAVPNPFNPSTALHFTLDSDSRVSLEVFDIKGRRVANPETGRRRAGNHKIHWDGRDQNGRDLPGGIYLATLTAGETSVTTRLVLVR